MKNPFDINEDGKLDLGEFALAAGALDEINRKRSVLAERANLLP